MESGVGGEVESGVGGEGEGEGVRGGVAPFGQVRLVVDENDHSATRLVRIRASVRPWA